MRCDENFAAAPVRRRPVCQRPAVHAVAAPWKIPDSPSPSWPGRPGWRIIRAMANGLTYIRKTTSPEATKQLVSTLAPYPVSYTHLDVYKRQFPDHMVPAISTAPNARK